MRGRTLSRLMPVGLLAILLTLLAGAVATAQSPVRAEVDRTRLTTDEQLLLTVTVTGDLLTVPDPDLSQLSDFRVVGSSRSTQISIINGELTAQGSFLYRLQPLREGQLVIPPISVDFEGQTYQTDPINIEVAAGSGPLLPPDEDLPSVEPPDELGGQVFVEAEVDNPTPYLGQQIVYTFKLYQASHLLRQPDYRPPSFTNFWGQNVLSQPHYNTTANGQDYLVTEIRTALFPADIGEVVIEAGKLVIPGGLFEPDIILETEPVSVQVQPLPSGAPANFGGAVGQFEISARLSAAEGTVDEPVTLVVEVTGTGNIETLTEPPLPELPNWRVFDSQLSTNIEARDNVVAGSRRFERLLVPIQPGNHTIPAISFSYFDPTEQAYRTVSTDPIPITIQPGEIESAPVTGDNGVEETRLLTVDDIRHIKPVPATLQPATASIFTNVFYWTCWILPALGLVGVWIWHKQRQRFLSDRAYARRVTARRMARSTLAEAEQQQGAERYALTQRALLRYLSDKLNQPTMGLTNEGLLNLLNRSALDPALVERIRITLEQIDIGRFAPVEETSSQALIRETNQLIDDLEKAFGRET